MGSGDKGGFLEQCDVGLGLKMQGSDCKRMTSMPHQYSCHYQCDGSGGGGGCGGGGGGGVGGGGSGDGGAICCSASNLVASVSDIYDVVGAGGGAAVPRTLHPFTADTSVFKPTGGMAASLRIPFTAAQWQELERQTMIYKYMMASVPVPPELLIPISRSLCDMTPSHSNRCLDLRYPNNSEPEPWRCRRTDGKKWRCSRDVAPDQKYCERHTHKGRPRSRKPVELHSELISNYATTADAAKSYRGKPHLPNRTQGRRTSALPSMGSAPPPPPPYGQARCSDWFAKGGEAVQQQWQNLMLFQSKVEGPKSSSSPSGSYSGGGVQRGLLLSPKLSSFQHPNNLSHGGTGTARDFIHAWSSAERGADGELNEVCNCEFPVSSRGKLPVSSLTLSMCGGNGSNEEEEEEEDDYSGSSSRNLHGGGELSFKSQTLNWMNPAPWMSSPPGGPLAEALCLGMASTVKPPPNAAPVHGGSSSSTTTTSSSSKSSCGDGGLQI